jgi:hypothetical protein
MVAHQLVGLPCSVCEQGIDSILEGDFCPACGGPVHRVCQRRQTAAQSLCPECGGDLSHPAAVEARRQKEQAARAADSARLMSEMPTRRFGFPSFMLLGFAIGAGLAVLVATLRGAGAVRFSYTSLFYLVVSLGSLGVYVGHIIGAVRHKEVGFKPLGRLTPGVFFVGATIVLVGSAVVLSAMMGIMTLAGAR